MAGKEIICGHAGSVSRSRRIGLRPLVELKVLAFHHMYFERGKPKGRLWKYELHPLAFTIFAHVRFHTRLTGLVGLWVGTLASCELQLPYSVNSEFARVGYGSSIQ